MSETKPRRRNLKREAKDFKACRALDAESKALAADLKKMCAHVDWDWDGSGVSPSLKMMVRFYAATTSLSPDRVRDMVMLGSQWLTTARDRYRRGFVGSPFGEERPRAAHPLTMPNNDLTVEESAKRDQTLILLEGCEHDISKPYRRWLSVLRDQHDSAPGEQFGDNAALVFMELRYLYRDQLPFGVGRDDPPINPYTRKHSCQPIMEWDRQRGARLTWAGMTTDY